MSKQQQARAFLQKVATDPGFRNALENDPIGTLAAHGFAVSASQLPPEGIKLPSNEAILKNLDHLSDRMEATSGEIFFSI